jgi:hypothetical protein
MPENHDEWAGFDEQDDFEERDEFDAGDQFDDFDDFDEAGSVWASSGYPPPGYPRLIRQGDRSGGRGVRHGLLIAATATTPKPAARR